MIYLLSLVQAVAMIVRKEIMILSPQGQTTMMTIIHSLQDLTTTMTIIHSLQDLITMQCTEALQGN